MRRGEREAELHSLGLRPGPGRAAAARRLRADLGDEGQRELAGRHGSDGAGRPATGNQASEGLLGVRPGAAGGPGCG